jgi:hypothetical protein
MLGENKSLIFGNVEPLVLKLKDAKKEGIFTYESLKKFYNIWNDFVKDNKLKLKNAINK